MYKVIVADHTLDVETGHVPKLNGHHRQASMHFTEEGGIAITMHGLTRTADLVELDAENKVVVFRMAGKKISVHIKDENDRLLERIGLQYNKSKKANQLAAPMPGLVVKILVEAGQFCEAGTPLLVLEAMKMENVFKAPDQVEIKAIHVNEKQSVEKGQVLIAFK